MTQRRGRLRAAVANAPLRTRVMAAAAILVALSSLATGILGATLLRGYLLDRADVQLQDFAVVASRSWPARTLLPRRAASRGCRRSSWWSWLARTGAYTWQGVRYPALLC